MSEDDLSPDDRAAAAAEPVTTEPPASFGGRLAWERQKVGLTVTDIAARLRLHPKQVRAIEEENLGGLPEPAYVRGFIRSYAKIVGIDPAPLLADLNDRIAPPAGSVVDGMTGNGDYSPVKAAARESASRRLVIGLAVVGLVALGVIGWYSTREQARPVAVKAPPASPVPPVQPTPAAMPSDAVAAAPPAASNAASTAEPAVPVDPEAPVRKSLLKLRFSGPSWVEVTDSGGKVLLSQHKAAGDEVLLNGTPPLSVVIGDASRVVVEVRGEEFSLVPVTRTNVARFVVK
jgi:cytoskeleton protein RodZ